MVKVGLCAITAAREKFEIVFATDLHSKRLELATKHGAIARSLAELRTQLLQATEGRGADAVIELVGHADALLTATELVRPYGVISSGGVHNQMLELPGKVMYGKK
jgi:threonine dehydrogenase-like Zn-dependent dehydrogenase